MSRSEIEKVPRARLAGQKETQLKCTVRARHPSVHDICHHPSDCPLPNILREAKRRAERSTTVHAEQQVHSLVRARKGGERRWTKHRPCRGQKPAWAWGAPEEDWHARGYRVATWPRSPEGSFTNVSVRFAKRFAGGSLRWRRTARTTARVSSNRG